MYDNMFKWYNFDLPRENIYGSAVFVSDPGLIDTFDDDIFNKLMESQPLSNWNHTAKIWGHDF